MRRLPRPPHAIARRAAAHVLSTLIRTARGRRGLVLVTAVGVLGAVTSAWSYWTTPGAGTAAAGVATLSVPGSPTATSSGANVSVSWTASTITGSVAATGYAVERYDGSGKDLGAASCSPVSSSAGNPNAFGSFTCTDSPGAGTYEYKIAAHYNLSWTATTGFTNTATGKNATTTTATGPATGTAGTAIAATSIGSTLSGATTGTTGTIAFKVFGPQSTAPTTCTSGGTTVGTAVPVTANSTYHPSTSFTPTTAGTYWWYASYSGDASNGASTSTCGAGMASTVVWSAASAASVTNATKGSTSAVTTSFTVQPGTTYLLLVFRHSGSSDGIASIASSSLSPALTLSSFTSIVSQTFNTSDRQWAYYLTTAANASGTGTLTVNFTSSLPTGGTTIVDLVQIGGNNTASPIVTANEKTTNGTGTAAAANLPSAPSPQDAIVVFLSGNASLGASPGPTASGLSSLFYSGQSTGSAGAHAGIPAQQTSTFSAISSQPWGTVAFELNHG